MPKFVVTDVSQCDLRVYRGYTVEAETAEQAIAMVHDPDQDHEPDWTDDKIVSEDDFDAWAVPAQEYEPNAERKIAFAGQPCTVLNHYRCDRCCSSWDDAWSYQDDVPCPECGHIVPPFHSDPLPKESP